MSFEVARVGFDVSQTGRGKAGCGFAAHGLLRGLAAVEEELSSGRRYALYPELGEHRLDGDPPVAPEGRFQLAAAPVGQDVELVHSNNFHCPVGLTARLVYTLYDLSFLAHPEWSTEANRVACWDGVFKASLHADLMLAISEASRRHFLETFPHYPESRTAVVPLASRFESGHGGTIPAALADSASPARHRGFLFTAGTLEPRKNHHGLLAAYGRYRQARPDPLPLVVAGGEGWLTDDLAERMERTEGVVRLGYVDDGELQWLYRHCRLFVYPSLFEGFGLPALEAMAVGAPVVASKISSLPEVVGDAGVLVDPRDEEALARALELAHDRDRCEDLSRRSRERASAFSWRRSAERVLELYAETLERPKFQET